MTGVLVDTTVWVAHIARSDARLRRLADDGIVRVHPYVLCELALGDLGPGRGTLLAALARMPSLPALPPEDVYRFIEHERLDRTGIGYVDAALLASARRAGARIWTTDRALRAAATRLRAAFTA